MLTLSVGKSGEEDFFTIQEALDSIPYEEKAVITVKEGIYREKLFSDKKDLVVRGEGKVLITYADGAREILGDGRKRGTFRSYTAFFSGERLVLENLTFQNSAGSGKDVGQALALGQFVPSKHSVQDLFVSMCFADFVWFQRQSCHIFCHRK